MRSVCIVGTGLIGASIGLALKAAGFKGEALGFDANPTELAVAAAVGAIDRALGSREAVAACGAEIIVLATPVLPVLDWMEFLAPRLTAQQMVTDVGSTKAVICEHARRLFGAVDRAVFLPGHPMAGKESGGAALAEASLFQGARWLFTPLAEPDADASAAPRNEHAAEWRAWVRRMGAQAEDIAPARHDEVCAWVSHLPQMLSTALAAQLEDEFAADAEGMKAVQAIGARALRETTRLGASPYSMWRDVALTNTENIAATLLALEQRLQHMRENLRTPELREEFARANQFRAK
jgi:prephenate dehydrogenase